MKFNSQICTTREQSERLLELGLKEETADFPVWGTEKLLYMGWSLHRLIEMMPPSIRNIDHYGLIYDIHRDWVCYMSYAQGGKCPYNKIFFESQCTNCYDAFIDCIEWLIKEGYFNKEYLEE